MPRKGLRLCTMSVFMMLCLVVCKKEDAGPAAVTTGPSIINHASVDLAGIPAGWIDSVKVNLKMHYAHTSHGEQLVVGLERIENTNASYNVAIGSSFLPSESGALCLFDGQEGETYITPDLYWATPEGMAMTRAVLNDNPTINISMFAWCTQMDYYSGEEVEVYLDSLAELETEFPQVTFVYMTGNAQATGAEGYNRYLRNEQIRQYCKDNNKFLFDFADIDAWWYNSNTQEWEQATYDYEGTAVPVEHSHYHGDEAGHTTYESCDQKGYALWWLLARISGWSGS